jgi:hypothetical protein
MYKSNISESLQFLVFCREALAQIIDASSMASSDKTNTKNFLYNEATDYQIMSLVVRGTLPEEKSNILDEVTLFDELKEQVISNIDVLSELTDLDSIGNFLLEVDTVYPSAGSARPVLEFLSENGMPVKEELTPTDIAKFARKWGRKIQDIPNPEEVARRALTAAAKKYDDAEQAVKAAARGVAQRAKIGVGQFMKDSDPSLDRLRAQKGNLGSGGQDMSPMQKASLAQTIRKGDPQFARMQAQKGGMGAGIKDLSQSQKDQLSKQTYGTVGHYSRKAKESWDSLMAAFKAKHPNAAQAMADFSKKAEEFAKSGEGKAIAAVALIALISYLSYKVYKAKFSQAAKACSGKKGPEKKQCMSQFKKQALMAQAQDMQKASSACAKTKDPAKCKAGIQAKIRKLQMKASKIR